MKFQKAAAEEFPFIRAFYWNLIDAMQEQSDRIGWKKGIYPSDSFLKESLADETLFTLKNDRTLCACVILNHACDEGYAGAAWSRDLSEKDVLIPHALVVSPAMQGTGVGRALMNEVLHYAAAQKAQAIRLDILAGNTAAERLYRRCGFRFVEEKAMFYEDTGLTAYRLYERNL